MKQSARRTPAIISLASRDARHPESRVPVRRWFKFKGLSGFFSAPKCGGENKRVVFTALKVNLKESAGEPFECNQQIFALNRHKRLAACWDNFAGWQNFSTWGIWCTNVLQAVAVQLVNRTTYISKQSRVWKLINLSNVNHGTFMNTHSSEGIKRFTAQPWSQLTWKCEDVKVKHWRKPAEKKRWHQVLCVCEVNVDFEAGGYQ